MDAVIQKGTLLATGVVVLLAGCGGGGGGGDATTPTYSLTLRADATSLPLNVSRDTPRIGGAYTTTLYAEGKDNAGRPIPDGEKKISCTIAGGLDGSGALYYLNGDPEHIETVTIGGVDVPLDKAYRSISVDVNSGVGTFHFHAYDKVGTPTIRCTVTDPSGVIRSAQTTLNVGGANTGRASQILMQHTSTSTLVPQGQNGTNQVLIQATMVDESGARVSNPGDGTNNLLVEIVPDATTLAEDTAQLRAVDAAGLTVSGHSIRVRSINGQAQFTLVSGNHTGPILLRATADRSDNNVDNGILEAVQNHFRTEVLATAQTAPGTPVSVTTTSLPAATLRVPYGAVLQAEGGTGPYTWTLSGGAFPAGLSLSGSGVISGTPSATVAGSYGFVVTATDSKGATADKPLAIAYTATGTEGLAPTVTTSSLPAGKVGDPYLAILTATGGTAPYSWAATGLPNGLVINAQGVISGTPAAAGTYPVAVTVTGASYFSSRQLSLTINP